MKQLTLRYASLLALSILTASCASEELITAQNCGNGVVESWEECDDGENNGSNAMCTPVCKIAVCGDGLVSPREQCDFGTANADTAACTSSCQHAVCGDGLLGPDEQCDDGPNNADSALCTSACTKAVCGDGLIGPAEQCDEGSANSDNGECTQSCVLNICGDGLVGPGEQCDEGSRNDDHGSCTSSCQQAACGDGLVGPGEQCDQGSLNADFGACTSECIQAFCGDGLLGPGEQCDDGPLNDDHGACTSTCESAVCGDGIIGPGEACDDGIFNSNSGYCTSSCTQALCGDGLVGPGEACDMAAANSDHGPCTTSCQMAVCGDGLVGPGEACDQGAANSNSAACTASCQLNICGDGLVGPGEQCDMGTANANSGACTPTCHFAECGDGLVGPGEECDMGDENDINGLCTPACIRAACGDGFVGPGEACDLGDLNDNQGSCTESCQPAACGDGYVGPGEECDHGTHNADTGACTQSCTAAYCGDGLVGPGEECDKGADNSDTIPFWCSTACERTAPAMMVTPGSHHTVVCGMGPVPIAISNTGTSNLIVSDITIDHAAWAHTAELPLTIPAGSEVTVQVLATPGTATVAVHSNTNLTTGPEELTLTVMADQAPVLAIDQTLDGATLDVGDDVEVTAQISDDLDDAGSLSITWRDSNGAILSTQSADENGQAEMIWPSSERVAGTQSLELIVSDSCGHTVSAQITVCQQAGYETSELDLENWHLEGNAQWNSSEGVMRLTDTGHYRMGSAFENTTEVNASDVAIEFYFYIGDGSGADGLSLTALDTARMTQYLGGNGCGIGYGGDVHCTGGHRLPGWAIEVDTYYNGGGVDPTHLDHVMFSFSDSSQSLWAPLPEMEDTGWHKMTVVVSAPHVYVAIDDVVYIDEDIDGNFNFDAYVGFTAATGGATNQHLIQSLMVTSYVCEDTP